MKLGEVSEWFMVPLSKSVSNSAIQFPQIRFCAVLPEAKQTFVSGCATLCWGVLNSLSPKCRQNNDLLKLASCSSQMYLLPGYPSAYLIFSFLPVRLLGAEPDSIGSKLGIPVLSEYLFLRRIWHPLLFPSLLA